MAEAENDEAGATQDVLALLKQYKPRETVAYERDVVSGRYRIITGQPLPQFSSQFAAAYAANDPQNPGAQLYALVYDGRTPMRQKNITVLREFRHPCLIALLDSGMAEISLLSETRYVAILEKPSGQKLSQVFSETRQQPMPQVELIDTVLRPLAEILLAFARAGISHNRINLENVYLNGKKIMLGECVSEPAGFSQDTLFEPVERIMTLPLAKPDYAINADCYALAVLILHLALGHSPASYSDKNTFIADLLAKGSFHMLAIQWDFSEVMQDFFRGLLNDGRRERWDPESIHQWLGGKHFNLIAPSPPNEASRGFDFMENIYYNRKALANSVFHSWPDSHTLLSDSRLGRWVETSVRKPEAGEMIVRLTAGSSSDNVRHERQNSEAMARILVLLDPAGPIRLRHLSVTVDGIGQLFASAFLSGAQDDLQAIVQILESDLPWFWAEHNPGTDHSGTLWKLQRVRSYMRINAPGFGAERCLYDLHPTLPCQSRLVKRYHVTGLRDLMIALDMLAQGKTAQDDCMDRHIAGFIAARLDIGKEIRISELDVIRRLASHPALVGLKLFIRAQNKIDNILLPGLAYWMVLRLMPLVDAIHKRSERRKLKKQLAETAASGLLKDIAAMLLNPEVFVADHNEFQKAVSVYQQTRKHITELKSNTLLMRYSRMTGRFIAQVIAYVVCLATMYYTMRMYWHF